MTDGQRSHRGEEARRILENEIFQEAISSLEKTYTEAWKAGKTLEAREDAHRYIQLIQRFTLDLKSVMTDGMVADNRIKELEGQPKKRWSL